jgi:predicted ArsR family transcriptional regulator
VHAAVPGRRYELLGRILAQAVQGSESDDAQRQVLETARAHGAEAGMELRPDGDPIDLPALIDLLRSLGYRPALRAETGTVRMRDCPFHDVSRDAPEVVCPANLVYVQGLLDGVGAAAQVHAVLDEAGAGCCVTLKTDI